MAPASRPDYKLHLEGLPQFNMGGQTRSTNTSAANSPMEPAAGSALKFQLGNGFGGGVSQAGTGRSGAGSPSKEYGSRLFPKRAREIQAQEGLSPQIWGPPTTGSGHSTPLRETIPESPGSDSFPDFDASSQQDTDPTNANTAGRRGRAGTVPSRFPPSSHSSGLSSPQSSLLPRTSRPTPTSTPSQSGTPALTDQQASAGAANAALLSRLRAGSMPQRSSFLHSGSPFGSSLFASNWFAGRDRASTLQSIRSPDGPSSPSYSNKDLHADNDVRTLDYLGLVDTPQQGRGGLSRNDIELYLSQQRTGQPGPTIADLAAMNAFNKNTASRFRSYSVNAKEKYADGEEDEVDQYGGYGGYGNQLTPTAEMTAAQALAINEAVRQHNLDVQAFANLASASRPRARTAGVLESPSSRVLRNYLPTPSRLDNSISAAELQESNGTQYSGMVDSMQNLLLDIQQPTAYDSNLDSSLESPTRALWLGNIPSSTTISSLNAIFQTFGPIESTRVLTHKSCGFVNFESVHSAMLAKQQYNNKELFPGCAPIRIGFAKVPSASNTPGANGAYPSPSPDPFVSKDRVDGTGTGAMAGPKPGNGNGNINAETAAAALQRPNLLELRSEIYSIVQEFGATPDDKMRIAANLETAMNYDQYEAQMPAVQEPNQHRIHDAPRLREIRKRIDNGSCSAMELEDIAMDMLPEIAELASDYLGNTVVQKLFEYCSETVKEAMLAEIAPRLAEIGVHKNGTWAAQKIIEVARTPTQMRTIVDAIKPYAVNLFLDQYGNYVIQGCLRFQAPMNNFIFETMLGKLWEVAQGRFGARAVRACLESHHSTKDQQRLMAAAVALHSVQLATNANGALLLTWLLDTCTFPRRRSVVAPRLVPHLVHLCTHKVAYLTVLKIVNQRNEPEARDSILSALFFSLNDQNLQDILSDQACGGTLIFKVLTTPFLDESRRPECLESVRNVLLRLKAQPSQGYKRLMDEVGLSTRHGGTPVSHDGRSSSRPRPKNAPLPHLDTSGQNGYGRTAYSNMTPQHQQLSHDIGSGTQRTISMESSSFDPYGNGLVTPAYTHSPAMSSASPVHPQQLQYQHAMLAQAQALQQAQLQQQMQRPPGFYTGSPVHSAMQNGNGYQSPAQQMQDPYLRGNVGSLPMVPPGMGAGFAPQQGYSPMMGMNGMGGYGQYGAPPPIGFFPQQQAQMQGGMAGGQRRGRR